MARPHSSAQDKHRKINIAVLGLALYLFTLLIVFLYEIASYPYHSALPTSISLKSILFVEGLAVTAIFVVILFAFLLGRYIYTRMKKK